MSEPKIDAPRPEDRESEVTESGVDETGIEQDVVEARDSGVSVRRIAVSLLVIAAIFAGIYLLDPGRQAEVGELVGDQRRRQRPAPRVGNPAPDFELTDLNGAKVTLSGLKGKPVWINFWASWCPPCRAETADVEAAYRQRQGQGLVLLAISIGEDAPPVRQFVSTYGMTSTVLLDSTEIAASRYRINGIPTHIFVDKDGVIRDLVVGGLNQSTILRRLDTIMQ